MENQVTQKFDFRFVGNKGTATEIRAVCTKCLAFICDRDVFSLYLSIRNHVCPEITLFPLSLTPQDLRVFSDEVNRLATVIEETKKMLGKGI